MSSRAVSTLSAVLLALAGAVLLFAGDEVARRIAPGPGPLVEVIVQLLGGAWLGVATIDWFTRSLTIGGIYGRPIVLGNLTVYLVTAATALKAAQVSPADPLLLAGLVAGVMTLLYGRLLFSSPV